MITMKPGIVADEMFPEGTNAIMDMDDEVHLSSEHFQLYFIKKCLLLFLDCR